MALPALQFPPIGTSPAELTADTSTEGRSSPESTNKRPQPEPAHPCVPSRTPALADLGATVLATLCCGNRPKRKSRTGPVNLPSPSWFAASPGTCLPLRCISIFQTSYSQN